MAPDFVVHLINEAIDSKTLKFTNGTAVHSRIDGALIRSDEMIAYPIMNEIPHLLEECGISLHFLLKTHRIREE